MAASVVRFTSQTRTLDYSADNLSLPNPTAFRLLNVLSAESIDTISCTLNTHDLEESSPYHCLSYTWGCPDPQALLEGNGSDWSSRSRPIGVNGSIVFVTKSLREALYRLKHGPAAHKLTSLWVDAVCINQDDIYERNKQVRLMQRIYGQAKTYDYDDPKAYEALGIPIISDGQWLACARLLERAWFERVWVLQESDVSPGLQMLCGDVEISWKNLVSLREFFTVTGWYTQFPSERWHCNGLNKPSFMSIWSRGIFQTFGFLDIQDMMTLICVDVRQLRSSTDPRDMVYGVLGCGPPELHDSIVMNYAKSVEDVFVEASLAIIRLSWSLKLLTAVGDPSDHTNSIYDLSSWVPDFSRPAFPIPMERMYVGEQFDAAPPTEIRLYSLKDARVLALDGFCIDVVSMQAGTLATDIMSGLLMLAPIARDLNTIHSLQSLPHVQTHDDETIVEVFWRTATANAQGSQYPAPAALGYALKSWLLMYSAYGLADPAVNEPARNYIRDLVRATSQRCVDNKLPTLHEIKALAKEFLLHWDASNGMLPEQGHEELFTQVNEWCTDDLNKSEEASEGRRIFVTRTGYVMLASHCVRPGDEVWVFAGSGTPFVLRRKQNARYCLMGETYMHGIMQGELQAQGMPQMAPVEIE